MLVTSELFYAIVPSGATIALRVLLREALFTSESVKLGHVRSCVDFCKEDMDGAETLVPTGSLNCGFLRF